MDKIRIRGGKPLKGSIRIIGAKNAALPLMCAALLSDTPLSFYNMPELADIKTLVKVLESLGVKIQRKADKMVLDAGTITSTHADYELVRQMRASILVLGPLLARMGKAEVSLPGGCAIGARPVDLHLKALEQMGADIKIEGGYIHASAPDGLKGAKIIFPKVTVTGTENILMAAVLAKGQTIIANAAREPEVGDLAQCLIGMGAKIEGVGSSTLIVEGVEKLNAHNHQVLPDRIETGTYIIAAAMTGGELTLTNTRLELLPSFLEKILQAGIEMEWDPDGTEVTVRRGAKLNAIDIMTEPYPGFATDLQAQTMALNCIADGAGMVTETIFENRFMHVPELSRMGANITIHGSSALVRGVPKLKGAPVMATDLRASVSLVLAGLAAEGETIVNRIYHLDRGYERIVEKLQACGADIERLHE